MSFGLRLRLRLLSLVHLLLARLRFDIKFSLAHVLAFIFTLPNPAFTRVIKFYF